MAPQTYELVRAQVRTGDLALCSGNETFSKVIRWATKSPWSHIAMIVRLDEIDRVMVVESVEKIGVRTVPLSRFVAQDSGGRRPYPGRILIARHAEFERKATPERLKALTDFAFDRFGSPFSGLEMAKIAARIGLAGFNVRLPGRLDPDDEFICSEYVAKCYEHVGIQIPWDGLGFIGPDDFAKAPPVDALMRVRT